MASKEPPEGSADSGYRTWKSLGILKSSPKSDELQKLEQKIVQSLRKSTINCSQEIVAIYADHVLGQVLVLTRNDPEQVQRHLCFTLETEELKLVCFKKGKDKDLMAPTPEVPVTFSRGSIVQNQTRRGTIAICAKNRSGRLYLLTTAHSILPSEYTITDEILETHQQQWFEQDLDVFTLNNNQEPVLIGDKVHALFGAYSITKNGQECLAKIDIAAIQVKEKFYNNYFTITASDGQEYMPILNIDHAEQLIRNGRQAVVEKLSSGNNRLSYGTIRNTQSFGFVHENKPVDKGIVALDLPANFRKAEKITRTFAEPGDSGSLITSPIEQPMRGNVQDVPRDKVILYGLLLQKFTEETQIPYAPMDAYLIMNLDYGLQALRKELNIDLEVTQSAQGGDNPGDLYNATVELFQAAADGEYGYLEDT